MTAAHAPLRRREHRQIPPRKLPLTTKAAVVVGAKCQAFTTREALHKSILDSCLSRRARHMSALAFANQALTRSIRGWAIPGPRKLCLCRVSLTQRMALSANSHKIDLCLTAHKIAICANSDIALLSELAHNEVEVKIL
jgi:hypothetical protein